MTIKTVKLNNEELNAVVSGIVKSNYKPKYYNADGTKGLCKVWNENTGQHDDYEGYPIEYQNGVKAFCFKLESGNWRVAEKQTGMLLNHQVSGDKTCCASFATKRKALQDANDNVLACGDNIFKLIDQNSKDNQRQLILF